MRYVTLRHGGTAALHCVTFDVHVIYIPSAQRSIMQERKTKKTKKSKKKYCRMLCQSHVNVFFLIFFFAGDRQRDDASYAVFFNIRKRHRAI